MSRNLVICLDGTDNQFSSTNTNVVRLFQSLERDSSSQLAYYDPGVGTIWEAGTLSRISQKLQMILGMAFGLGVTRNVAEAYEFLMRHYQDGDRIYLFGFSRGALEARALAGLLHRCGVLEPQLTPLSSYAVRLFQTPGDYAVVGQFRHTFSRRVTVAFLGVWDTVTSMGNVWSPIHWPHTTSNASVERVAHAIAIDERRAFFRQNRWQPGALQQCREVWFPGVHSDVGGGYPAASGRLWTAPLAWMVGEAESAGLRVNQPRLQQLLAEGKAPGGEPDHDTAQHDSLTWAWKPLELVPRPRKSQRADGSWRRGMIVPALHAGFRGRPRAVKPGELVHVSALARFVARDDYRPPTLVNAGLTKVDAEGFLATDTLYWTVPTRERT